jgi:hypothetical protein
LGRTTQLLAVGQDIVVGYAQRLELHTYSLNGALRRIARGPFEDLSLGTEWRRDYKSAQLDDREEHNRELVEIAGNPMPATVPAYTALKGDLEGNLWVRRFALGRRAADSWGVFAVDGRFLGHVSVPSGLEIYEIGPDYILAVASDSLGVQRVQGFRLRR